MAYKKVIESVFGKTRTFYITEDCNLRCRYCYEENKVCKKMSIETAKSAFDYFIKDVIKNPEEKNIWDLIGGEPFTEIEFLKEFTNYMLDQFSKYNIKPCNNYLSFTTNGTLFTDEVKEYLLDVKNKIHLSVGLSLDGIKEIHDYNRSNSFDKVMENFDWWRTNFPFNTIKATLNHEAIPYIFESIKFFIDLNLDQIFMNTVFEDVWKDGDDKLYYEQLIKVADYLLEDNRYENIHVTLFSPTLLVDPNKLGQTWCGCGNMMITVDSDGKLYPCLRFRTLSKQSYWDCGDINNGIDYNKLLPFKFYHNLDKNDECLKCEYRSGCAWCPGHCYDELGTIFGRTKYMCNMHKSRVKANRYFFESIAKKEGKSLEEILIF